MSAHILNRPAPPSAPKPAARPKPTADQKRVAQELKRTKAAEAVERAIARNR